MPLVSFSVTACLSGGPMSPRRATLGLMAVQQDYDAIWKEIEGSPLAGVYIRELYWLARTVVSALDRLFANGLGPNEMSPMHVSGRMNDVAEALNAGARIRTMIRERPRRSSQNRIEHEIQSRRARWLRQAVLGRVHFEELVKADVRHSLEHFERASTGPR